MGQRRVAVGANDRALEAGEEEELVLADRTADDSAELVAFQVVANLGSGGGVVTEVVGRVEHVVADELEDIAVEAVAAAFGDGVDGRGGVVAILRGE